MAQQVEVVGTMPSYLSSTPGARAVKGENRFQQASACASWCTWMYSDTLYKENVKKITKTSNGEVDD